MGRDIRLFHTGERGRPNLVIKERSDQIVYSGGTDGTGESRKGRRTSGPGG